MIATKKKRVLRRGAVRRTPQAAAGADPSEIKKAIALFRGFTGHAPAEPKLVKIKPFKLGLAIGRVAGVIYTVDATGERMRHEFKVGSRPHLIVSNDGKTALICGGRFRFTKRGFVDG